MTGPGMLLAASVAVPLAMLAACVSPRLRARMSALLPLAPVPALVAALLAQGGVLALPQLLLRVTLSLDLPGAILLGVSALLWIAAGAYAASSLRSTPGGGRFAAWWLATLTGSLGVFLAADLVSFFLLFAMVSLAAFGLVIHDGTPRARRAAVIYLFVALLGEGSLLMGFVLLAAATPGGSLLIHDTIAALPASPWRNQTLALLILGLGLKMALVPLHVWMPLAYRAAPIPASAVLSGAAVKAGVIGMVRVLPFAAALPGWGGMLAAAGLASAFYGVAIGITQVNPKTVLAYSSVSQMGVMAAVFGMGLSAGESDAALAASLYAAHHVLVKGALFLGVGVAQRTDPRRLWLVLLPAAVLALSLGGLPPTGGSLAKLAVKATLGTGRVGLLATLSASGTTLLMLHFLGRLRSAAASRREQTAPASLAMPWLVTAVASVAVPWALYLTVGEGTVAEVFAPAALWTAIWPVLLGAGLALCLRRWWHAMPRIPEGDVVVFAPPVLGMARRSADMLERLEERLRQWPVAGVSLLALVVVLALLASAGR